MADQFGLFWNSINADRTYDADSFAEWLRKFFTTGVFNGEMQVTPGAGMAVSVAPGYANLNGKVRFFDAAQTFTLDPASGTYPRIDTIVVRSDSTNRVITTEYVKGAYSGNNPVPTAPVRTAGIYEIVLAQIYVGAGITAIIADDITDTRPDDVLCGWVAGTVEGVPVDQIVTQMQAQFLTWFDEMKGQLSEDAAGHLQLEIDELSDSTSNSITTLGNRVEGIRSGVATLEFSPTISAHTAGDYFFATSSQGHIDLFKALVDIPAGTTLVEGTNVDFAVLADDLKAGLTYKAGDSVSFSGEQMLGRITMSGTDAYVSVILPKPISANRVSITMTSANVFGATASTDASSTTVSNVSMNKQLGRVSFSFPMSRAFTGGTVCVAEFFGTIIFS